MKLYLQNIINDIPFENLPAKWQGFDFSRFSKEKTLFDFQQDALKNALKGLWLYFIDKKQDKQALFNLYHQMGLTENLDYNLNREKKTAKYLLKYPDNYPVIDKKISFAYFINRMSFWMATGSGKTLVIIKLIEFLGKLIFEKELPVGDILFLAHRDDLLEQFKNHIDEFNSFNFDTKINLKNFRDYDSVKRENTLPFSKNEITVFYYRSDLISDEHKEKIVNFQNYDNSGRWYILLDEAHKGDKEDSKRQVLYSILSRNGFLFNFSATFTDNKDFATCAFRYNLADFVYDGYAKHIYISEQDVSAFREKNDFSKEEKQKIVLKTLILLTYINKYFEKIREVDNSLYHRPLLLTLVNSVDIEKSDLELFFRELEKIAKNEIKEDLLEETKQELVQHFNTHKTFQFEDLEFIVDNNLISKIGYTDILKYIFNAKTPGKIEVLKIPGNKQELIFRLMTSEKPFALIKIGDISEWLKNKLGGYEINESFENESYFRHINSDDSDINILMGSRVFYEGWDSNRPNIILFINIGVKNDAKKFVLQSIGRGVRIEPIKNKRRRVQKLLLLKEIDDLTFDKLKDLVLPIESVFIFGTNPDNLKEIIATLKTQESRKKILNAFIVNPEAKKHKLLIPVYKKADKLIVEEISTTLFRISKSDFELVKRYFSYLDPKIILVKHRCEPKVLESALKSFSDNEKNKRYDFSENRSIQNPELNAEEILKFLGLKIQKLDTFKILEKEIIHFEEISVVNDKNYEKLKNKITFMSQYPIKKKELENNYGKISAEEYNEQLKLFEKSSIHYFADKKIKIKYLANHYYIPVIISESDIIDYLDHIIKVESERKFIEELEEYLKKPNNFFSQFDWWMFSKLDQTLDKIGILYYNQKEGRLTDFTPDFIFWLQKKQEYIILFVDPHGTVFRDADLKIDWFEKIFNKKEYSYLDEDGNLKIKVRLLFKPAQGTITSIPEKYRNYWFDNFDALTKI